MAKEFPDASNSEISVKLGEIWNQLTSEQQKPYFQKAESLKAVHKQNYPNYVYQPRQAKPKSARNRTSNRGDNKEEKEKLARFSSCGQGYNSRSAFHHAARTQGKEGLHKSLSPNLIVSSV